MNQHGGGEERRDISAFSIDITSIMKHSGLKHYFCFTWQSRRENIKMKCLSRECRSSVFHGERHIFMGMSEWKYPMAVKNVDKPW